MVGDNLRVYDKKRGLKKTIKIFVILIIIGVIGFCIYYTATNVFSGKIEIILNNPLEGLIAKYTVNETLNVDKVVEQGVLEFNESYIDYLLVALGSGNLHKSILHNENPFIEVGLDNEIWSSEIIKGMPNSEKKEIDNEDIKVIMSKEEAVKAILSEDIEEFMVGSVNNGNTEIEKIAGEFELFSKGYLKMYDDLKE